MHGRARRTLPLAWLFLSVELDVIVVAGVAKKLKKTEKRTEEDISLGKYNTGFKWISIIR